MVEIRSTVAPGPQVSFSSDGSKGPEEAFDICGAKPTSEAGKAGVLPSHLHPTSS